MEKDKTRPVVPNVPNRTLFCRDNLDVLRGINGGCIDLIYLDPPFNKKKVFSAPIGSSAEGAEFSDIFREEDVKDEWVRDIEQDHPHLHALLDGVRQFGGTYNYCYLCYMAIRLLECHRVLKDTGSIYLHCDPTMSHYLKLALDCIFGEKRFRNEIVWCYTGPSSPGMKQFARKHDIIFWYSKGKTWTFNVDEVRLPYKESTKANEGRRTGWTTGNPGSVVKLNPKGKFPEDWVQLHVVAPASKERTKYPTQKPLALLRRIIKASSNRGDVVLDPFCGCATTLVAAEAEGRQWIGADISHKAYEMVKMRIEQTDGLLVREDDYNYTTKAPRRTDTGESQREEKHVYIISNPSFDDLFKVGVAKDVNARLSTYQTGDPHQAYKKEYSLKTPHFNQLERHIHSTFRYSREWVRGSVNEIRDEMERKEEEYRRQGGNTLLSGETKRQSGRQSPSEE